MKSLTLITALFFITSCGQDLTTSGKSSSQSFSATTCSCTAQYNPVCGIANGQLITYTNACVAQCNGSDYTNGACGTSMATVNGTQCNINSGIVCGRIITTCDSGLTACTQTVNAAQYFDNECQMVASNAEKLSLSDCN